jgi:hypothetical protein
LAAIPGIGPALPYIAAVIAIGAVISTALPAPAEGASALYRTIYGLVQWCALNKGHSAVAPTAATKPATTSPPKVSSLLGMLAVAATLGVLSACATPQTARQAIYQAAGAYDAALKTTTAYARLPRCGQPTSPPVCSDQALVTQASTAAQLALPAVNAAIDTAANTSASDSALSQAQTAAATAVAAFTTIAAQLGSH